MSRRSTPRLFSLVMLIGAGGCASHGIGLSDYGILPCPAAVEQALLEPAALQCWWPARHGRWRTLSHESHYDALVVDVEVSDIRDTREIASRFVESERVTYAEILIYGHPGISTHSGHLRRVRWSRIGGFEILDIEIDTAGR